MDVNLFVTPDHRVGVEIVAEDGVHRSLAVVAPDFAMRLAQQLAGVAQQAATQATGGLVVPGGLVVAQTQPPGDASPINGAPGPNRSN